MKTPISINENGDVSIFETVEEAEAYMEPMDVERGEYTVLDADGRQLDVVIAVKEVPIFFGLWKTRLKKIEIRCVEG
jgi:hypothetical protein